MVPTRLARRARRVLAAPDAGRTMLGREEAGDAHDGTDVNVGSNTSPETFTFGSDAWFATDRAT